MIARLSGFGIISVLLVALVGCSAPNLTPTEPAAPPAASVEGENTAPDNSSTGGSVSIDPAWPWPASLPRPAGNIHSEFTSANALGDGAIYTLEFTAASLEAAQEYADALRHAGLEWMLDGKLATAESGDTEMSVVAMTEGYMSSLTVDSATLHTEFSFIGIWE